MRRLLKLFSKSSGPETRRGFTLIELLVVLAIIVIISLIIFLSAGKFNSAILLRSLAYDVGLAVREAQLYGVAVKESSGAPETPTCAATNEQSQFCASYGVHFDKADDAQFFVFADADQNGIYDASGDGPAVDTFDAQYGFTISDFCAQHEVGGNSKVECSTGCPKPSFLTKYGLQCSGGQGNKLTALDVTFERPNPDANITPTNATPPGPYTAAFIFVASPAGSTRAVEVTLTGQIVVLDVGT